MSILPLSILKNCTNLKNVYIPSSISNIQSTFFNAKVENLYLAASEPPSMSLTTSSIIENLYVPTESLDKYENSIWKNANNIIGVEFVKELNVEIPNYGFRLQPGEETKLNITISPSDAVDSEITIVSENPNIAIANSDGTIKAVSRGSTYVYVSCGSFYKRIGIDVGRYIYYNGLTFELYNFNGFECCLIANENGAYEGDIEIPDFIPQEDGIFTVTAIDRNAFKNGEKIKSIVIPKTIKKLEHNLFFDCVGLSRVIIEDSDTPLELGQNNNSEGLFSNCGLNYIYIGRDLSFPNCLPFRNTASPFQVEFSKHIENIPPYLFRQAYGLTNIILPENINSIGDYSFSECYNLGEITFPPTIESVGNYAFYSCSNLKKITFESSENTNNEQTWGNYVFWGIDSAKEIWSYHNEPPY